MSYFLSALVFLVIFSLLILIHEFGHFYAARRAGVKVEEFGMGLPPRACCLWKDRHGTIFSLNWIPFGGFVRMYGEDSPDESLRSKHGSFSAASLPARVMIVLGGVIMNFLLGYILLVYLMVSGAGPFVLTPDDLSFYREKGTIVAEDSVEVLGFSESSQADDQGMMKGDTVLRVDGRPVSTSKEFISFVSPNPGRVLDVLVLREGKEVPLSLTVSADGKMGIEIRDFPKLISTSPLPLGESFLFAAHDTVRLSWYTMKMFVDVLWNLVSRAEVSDQVSGPVGIFQLTHVAAQKGIDDLLRLVVLLSISLGAINVLPIPALDGGRFLTLAYELITRRKPNASWEARIHAFGFIFLITLIAVITYKDIVRLIVG